MKFFSVSIFFVMFGGLLLAQELAIKDPQNMKIDQIKKGITKLIGEIQHQNDRMAIFEQQLKEESVICRSTRKLCGNERRYDRN